MVKKYIKQTKGLIGAGVLLGAGSQIIGGVGGSQLPITKTAAFMPAIGTAIGATAVMRIVKNKTKKRKRRR